jgi:hypothetical protein
MAKPDMLVINDKAQDRLVQYMNATATIQDEGWQNRTRFENIDRSYMRTKDFTAEQKKAERANKAGDPTKLQNMQVPLVMESVENSVGFLSNVFLLDYPMFKFGSEPATEDLALMWNTLVGEDQVHYGWAGQFNIAFRNSDKYNFAPIEVDWKEEVLYKVSNGNGPNGAVLTQEVWAGNCITAHDVYNTVYDPRVPIYRNHIDGEFAGYVKPMSRIQLKLFLASLGQKRLKNDVKAFESAAGSIAYYIPQINPDTLLRQNMSGIGFDWIRWVTDDAQRHIAYKNMYTVLVLYARIMPYEFGIQAPKDQTPDIWKLIKVNDILVYAEPVPNAHNYLPLIIVQSQVDHLDHQTKSSAENQMPFQDMTSALWNAELNIARRAAVDRMLYNPLLIDPDHINSPNPGAKIPVKPTAYGRKLEEAIYKIPFEGAAGGLYLQAANGVAEWGMRANGQNRVSVGQFQKGNKLENEFNTTMANAGARDRTKAIMWETNGMQPIKTILKNNYLQFTPEGKRYNRETNSQVNIEPSKLREAAGDFQVGDGLLPIEKLMHADVAQGAFQALASNPAIAQSYQMAPFFSYLMKLQGVDKLSQFEQDPAMLGYQNALATWTAQAMELTKSKPSLTVEEALKLIEAIIGPKPQDPTKQQTQPQPQTGVPNGNVAA